MGDKKPGPVDVVVVKYHGNADRLYNSMKLHSIELGEYRVIEVDNTTNDDRMGINQMRHIHHGVSISVGSNVGWVKGANIGLALSTSPFVILMNDDTRVETDGWIQRMREACSIVGVGAVGPHTNHH